MSRPQSQEPCPASGAASSRPLATLSVDVDPAGVSGRGDGIGDPILYSRALPRLAEVFRRTGVRATFFVVGRDAGPYSRALAALAAAGHEIASHSFSHPFAFARLTPAQMRDELVASRNALESATGTSVVGHRAPHFDLDARGIHALIEAGYHYDASAYPTPHLLPARLAAALRSPDVAGALRLRLWPFTMDRTPHRWGRRPHSLTEFPVSVTPWMRLPVAHTARYDMEDARFVRSLDGFVARREPLSYPLRALDAIGCDDGGEAAAGFDRSGRNWPAPRKLDLLERTIRAIADRFEVATFAARAEALRAAPLVHRRELPAA